MKKGKSAEKIIIRNITGRYNSIAAQWDIYAYFIIKQKKRVFLIFKLIENQLMITVSKNYYK